MTDTRSGAGWLSSLVGECHEPAVLFSTLASAAPTPAENRALHRVLHYNCLTVAKSVAVPKLPSLHHGMAAIPALGKPCGHTRRSGKMQSQSQPQSACCCVCNHAPSAAYAVKSGAMYWMVIATLTSGLPGGTNAITRRSLRGRGQDRAGQGG